MSINTTTLPSTAIATVGGGGGGGPPPPSSSSYLFHDLNNIGLGYSIAIALGFLILLSAVLLSSYLCFRFTRRGHHRHNLNPNHRTNNSDNGIIVPRIVFVADDDDGDEESGDRNGVVGLDQAAINSYPKFTFSKDRRGGGGGGNDSVCSICLCEYKEAEMMRMLPDCRHCFHLSCVDAWLKLNASCPVCRSSPLPTPLSTPLSEVVPLSLYSDGGRRR